MSSREKELELKGAGTDYAFVTRSMGNGRFSCSCLDGNERQAGIRGKMRNREFIRVGDCVLLSIFEFNDDQAAVVHKYTPENVRELRQRREIPDSFGAAVQDGADGLGDIFGEDTAALEAVEEAVEAEEAHGGGAVDIDAI